MRILIVTDYLPYPPISGDRIRVYSMLRQIARHHSVSVVGFLQSPEDSIGISHLRRFCERVEALALRRRARVTRIPGLLRHVVAGIPFEFEFLRSDELACRINELASSSEFDIIQFEQSRMAPYLDALPADHGSKCILVLHNLAADQYDRISHIELARVRRLRAWLHGRMLRRWEPRYAERFDHCITVSERDRSALMMTNPRLKVDVVPNGVDTRLHRPLAWDGSQASLLFIGNLSYAPNTDGALWFCKQILPEIRRRVGGTRLCIVGNAPPPELLELSEDGTEVTGRVDSILPYYRRCRVAVVPLRAGGGTRLKILEAMALGRPVVSTSIGCEGLDVEHGRHILIADTPNQFAEATVCLLTDLKLCQRLSMEARELVVTKYDWDVVTSRLLDVYSELACQADPVSAASTDDEEIVA